jgi:hypothetical protein
VSPVTKEARAVAARWTLEEVDDVCRDEAEIFPSSISMSASLSTSPGPSPSTHTYGPSDKALGKRRAASPPSEDEESPAKRPRVPEQEETIVLNGASELGEQEESGPSDEGRGRHDEQHTSPTAVDALGDALLATDPNALRELELDLPLSDIAVDPAASAGAGVQMPPIDLRRPARRRPSPSKPLSSAPIPSSSAKGKQKAQTPVPEPAGEPLKPFSAISCPICLGPPSPLTVTRCGHVLCVTLSHTTHCTDR